MPDGIDDRNADVWEPLLAVADLAGGEWPKQARVAAVTVVTDSKAGVPSLGIRLLADLRDIFGDQMAMSTDDILKALHRIEDAPWADLRGTPLNARGLSNRLGRYQIKRSDVRIGEWHGKGYKREDLWDAWTRYLPNPPGATDDAATEDETQAINTENVIKEQGAESGPLADVGVAGYESVTSVTPVTNCRTCGRNLIAPASQQRGICESCYVQGNGKR